MVMLDPPGPPYYLQWRSGRVGRPFWIVKLQISGGADRLGPALAGERERELGHPAFEPHLHGAGTEAVADLLQPGRIVAGGEPAGSSVKPILAASAWRLAHSCPFTHTLIG